MKDGHCMLHAPSTMDQIFSHGTTPQSLACTRVVRLMVLIGKPTNKIILQIRRLNAFSPTLVFHCALGMPTKAPQKPQSYSKTPALDPVFLAA